MTTQPSVIEGDLKITGQAKFVQDGAVIVINAPSTGNSLEIGYFTDVSPIVMESDKVD